MTTLCGRLRRLFLREGCAHANQRGIYGDEINARNGARAECLDCRRRLPDLPVDHKRRRA